MRLIDADELLKIAQQDGAYDYVSAHEIVNAPTIEAKTKEECDACYDSNWFNKDWTITAHIKDDEGHLTSDEDLRRYANIIDNIVLHDYNGNIHEYTKVIRCKDCKHKSYCETMWGKDDFFCSNGELEDENQEREETENQ